MTQRTVSSTEPKLPSSPQNTAPVSHPDLVIRKGNLILEIANSGSDELLSLIGGLLDAEKRNRIPEDLCRCRIHVVLQNAGDAEYQCFPLSSVNFPYLSITAEVYRAVSNGMQCRGSRASRSVSNSS